MPKKIANNLLHNNHKNELKQNYFAVMLLFSNFLL